jgi:hypothetical protein
VRRPRWHTPLLVVLSLAGVAGLAIGGFALHAELTRPATAAEAAAAGRAEIATRWQRLPAGRLFPATISYLSAGRQQTTARRVGIAPAASCAAALDPAVAAIFRARGCRAVLRASYTDSSGSLTVTAVAGRGPSGSNPAGTVGLAAAARILSIKVPNRAAGGTWQRDIGAAIRYAASHGAQVIYVSEESFQDDAVLDSAVEYATARNAVVISPEFTFRNAPPSVSTVPDSLPGVLGAASVVLPGLPKPPHGMRYPANESILVAAPANALTVSGPLGQGYEMFDSLASAAWLTATVALIKSVYPHLPASLADLAIARSARDHPRAGWSPQVGFGLINPDGALHQAAALAKVPVTAPGGGNSLADSAHLGAGPPPGVIAAVHHSTSKEALFAGAMAAGLVLLMIAAALAFSWRKSPRRKLENPTGA